MVRGSTLKKPERSLMASIHNRFDIEVIDAKTGEVKQRAKAENVILNQLWDVFLSGWFGYLAYGSGTGTPSVSDTSLFNKKGVLWIGNTVKDTSHLSESYISFTASGSLSETDAVGVTITELGLINSNKSSGKLCTHAMLQDMNGTPISILKTDTDIINLYATVFFHWDPEGYNGVKFVPKDSDFPVSVWGSSGVIYARGASVGVNANTSATTKFDATTRTLTISCSSASVSDLNIGGFNYVRFEGFLVEVLGPYRVTGESVGTGNGSKKDFSTKFDLPSNATVYVDGVVATNVEVSEVPLKYTNMGKYFWSIDEQSTVDNLIPGRERAPDNELPSGTWANYGLGLFYNPFYMYGLTSYSYSDLKKLQASNDLKTWETVFNYTTGVDNPISNFKNHKFWRSESRGSSYSDHYWGSLRTSDLNGKNIHFSEAPARGAVITIDYDTPMVPKDENHVYDLEVKIQLGAYGE